MSNYWKEDKMIASKERVQMRKQNSTKTKRKEYHKKQYHSVVKGIIFNSVWVFEKYMGTFGMEW